MRSNTVFAPLAVVLLTLVAIAEPVSAGYKMTLGTDAPLSGTYYLAGTTNVVSFDALLHRIEVIAQALLLTSQNGDLCRHPGSTVAGCERSDGVCGWTNETVKDYKKWYEKGSTGYTEADFTQGRCMSQRVFNQTINGLPYASAMMRAAIRLAAPVDGSASPIEGEWTIRSRVSWHTVGGGEVFPDKAVSLGTAPACLVDHLGAAVGASTGYRDPIVNHDFATCVWGGSEPINVQAHYNALPAGTKRDSISFFRVKTELLYKGEPQQSNTEDCPCLDHPSLYPAPVSYSSSDTGGRTLYLM